MTVRELRDAIAQLQDGDVLCKLEVTHNLGIIRDKKQVGYIDVHDGTIDWWLPKEQR